MILKTAKCIFVHLPRTAGTSIEAALGGFGAGKSLQLLPQYGPQHVFASELITHPKSFFKFTFVRNPWDRILSYYLFRISPKSTWVPMEEKTKSFREWLEFNRFYASSRDNAIALNNQIDNIRFDRQLIVDFIGRFEHLQTDWAKVCSVIGESRPLPHVNKNAHPHYTKYYDKATRAIVSERYRPDIDFFKYKFGD